MTDAFELSLPGDRELERRLEAFADLRLTPTGLDTTRVRMQVMALAHRRAALLEAGRSAAIAESAANLRRSRWWRNSSRTAPGIGTASAPGIRTAPATRAASGTRAWLRPIGAMSAALMTLALLAGTAAAARPGGPLYAALLSAERLTLPGETTARANAETRRLDARLTEALTASQAGDETGAVAALTAYSSIVFEAATDIGGDRDAAMTIQDHIVEHAASLSSMLGRVSEPARARVEAAIVASTRFLHRNDLDAVPAASLSVAGATTP